MSRRVLIVFCLFEVLAIVVVAHLRDVDRACAGEVDSAADDLNSIKSPLHLVLSRLPGEENINTPTQLAVGIRNASDKAITIRSQLYYPWDVARWFKFTINGRPAFLIPRQILLPDHPDPPIVSKTIPVRTTVTWETFQLSKLKIGERLVDVNRSTPGIPGPGKYTLVVQPSIPWPWEKYSDHLPAASAPIKFEVPETAKQIFRPLDYTGIWEERDEQGSLRQIIHYKDGIPHGDYLSWDSRERLASKGFLQEGVAQGSFTRWHKNGKLQYFVSYRDGKHHGESMRWDENGTKINEMVYENGMFQGKRTMWYPNGTKRFEGSYSRHKRHDHWVFWDEKGVEIGSGEYRDGKPWNGRIEFWNPHGRAGWQLADFKDGKRIPDNEAKSESPPEKTYD